MGLVTKASVAIDGSKFKAVNTRDKNFTKGKVARRRQQLEDSGARYLAQLDTADLQEPSETLAAKTAHLNEKLAKLTSEMQKLEAYEKEMLASPDQQISLTDPDSRSMATSHARSWPVKSLQEPDTGPLARSLQPNDNLLPSCQVAPPRPPYRLPSRSHATKTQRGQEGAPERIREGGDNTHGGEALRRHRPSSNC